VHEITNEKGQLRELFKATGGPYGSITVDEAFERLLEDIFGRDLMSAFKVKRPSGFIDLMIAFESRKRGCGPNKLNPLNIALPFSFIDFYRKIKGKDVGYAITKYGSRDIKWVSHGMLRIDVNVMRKLFHEPVEKIIEQINKVLLSAECDSRSNNGNGQMTDQVNIGHLFLVGGFAESAIVQEAIRTEFRNRMRVIIPQGASVAVLRGAVLYGLDPSIVHVRRAMKTYGLGVIKPFLHGYHPRDKLVIRDGKDWCVDVFDRFVSVGQSVSLGEAVVRMYKPVVDSNRHIVMHIFSSDRDDNEFITDPEVELCGTLSLSLEPLSLGGSGDAGRASSEPPPPREIQAKMSFGDTEIKASAVDVKTNQTVRAFVDFLNESNPKYLTKL